MSMSYNSSKPYLASTFSKSKDNDELTKLMNKANIVVFAKSFCGYSRHVIALLKTSLYQLNVSPTDVNKILCIIQLNESPYNKNPTLQHALFESTNITTVPQVFMRGRYTGDCQEIQRLSANNELEELLLPLLSLYKTDPKRK